MLEIHTLMKTNNIVSTRGCNYGVYAYQRIDRWMNFTGFLLSPAVLFTFRQPMYMIMESLGNMAMVCVDKLGNTTETFAVSVTGE